ncbi:MAG: hypothetical protein KJ668_22065, partial [Proteobacteria bacterium]|nr:hypothetical protein [Pseudomonadota bacterium]
LYINMVFLSNEHHYALWPQVIQQAHSSALSATCFEFKNKSMQPLYPATMGVWFHSKKNRHPL